MKIFGILIALVPILVHADSFENDPLFPEELADEFFSHIEYDGEEVDSFLEDQGVEIENSQCSRGLVDAIDLAAEEEISGFVERRASEINEDYEELLGYSFPKRNDVGEYSPSLEKVPEQRKQLIGSRPKVVQDGQKEGKEEKKGFIEKRSMPLASQKMDRKESPKKDSDQASR